MDDLLELQSQRRALWKRVKGARTLLIRAREVCEKLEYRHTKCEKDYEAADYQLALLDGRFAKVQASQRKAKEPSELTLDQIHQLMETLGVALEEANMETERTEALSNGEEET